MRGRPPKDPSKVKRRNLIPSEQLVAPEHPAKPPALGTTYRTKDGPERFLPETKAWWRTWTTSAQSAQFTGTDWQRLKFVAPLVDQFHREPRPGLLAEIRLNEERFGATVSDRRRLHWAIVEAPGPRDDPRRRARRDPRGLHVVPGVRRGE